MTKVNINGHDHQVEIDAHDSPLDAVVDAARQLWLDTVQPPPAAGPAGAGPVVERGHRAGFAWRLGAGAPLGADRG